MSGSTRVAPRLVGAAPHRGNGSGHGFVAEERVEDHRVHAAPRELESALAHRDEQQRNVLVERRVLLHERELPRGAIVADDGLTLPEPAQDPRHVFELRAGDGRAGPWP